MKTPSGVAAGLIRAIAMAALLHMLGACGGGGVSDPTAEVSAPLSITPSQATLYADLPTTFVVSGGNGNYIATSSDQNALPIATAFSGNVLTVVPNQVASDTPVTLTIRDTSSTAPVSAALTIRPRTLSNVVTVTPSSATCGTAVCAGSDAQVSVVLSQGDLPLAGRQVRFDVVSGDFRIITSSPGVGESLALSATTITDSSGTARVRVRALSDARSQTGLIDITDLGSGLTRHSSISIAPLATPALAVQPASVAFVGRDSTACASGISADVIVTGGQPPYSISQSAVFGVSPIVLAHSGDRFTVSALGLCGSGSIGVVDSLGAGVSVAVTNALGTTVTFPTLAVAPEVVTLTSCSDRAQISVAGGRGPGTYTASSGNAGVLAQANFDYVQISRITSAAPLPGPVTVTISDGRSIKPVTVNLTGNAAGLCTSGTP